MKNMTFKEKFLFIFLQIVTIGLIWIYWNQKTKKYKDRTTLSQEVKVGVNIIKLINSIGGPNNIKEVNNTHTKVKISFNFREKIDLETIKTMVGISGVFINDSSLILIVGNSAHAICESIKSNL